MKHSPPSQPASGTAIGGTYDQKRARYMEERRRYWDSRAATVQSHALSRHYRRLLIKLYRFLIPPGARVLELGSGSGELLAALNPAYGVGVDLSPKMVERAQNCFPHLHFCVCDAQDLNLGEEFDFIVASDLVNDLWDVQGVFEAIARHAHPSTRLVLNCYSRLWEIPRRVAELLRICEPLLPQNWLTSEDVVNLLGLAGLEPIRASNEIMWPVPTPVIDSFCNRYLTRLWPLRFFGITNLLVARPSPKPMAGTEPLVTVVVPARNEAGNIQEIFDRMPRMGSGTELIFVEGHSTDGTYAAIEREIARRPGKRVRLFRQTGKGKGDAVRLGFSKANGDVLMILDADLTVPPEDLPRFYAAWRSSQGEFINGVRLVYPMEDRAMRFFNFLGNKFFSLAFSWLLSQNIKDTLCGTKVLSKRHYQIIAANRAYFGELDPFGDFDLIFGAAKYSLKFVDLPVRYRERTYGKTNIHRLTHGWLLLRMMILAMRRIKFV